MVVFASLSSLKYFLLIPLVTSLSFNFDTFTPNDHNVTYERDASPENGAILITKNLLNHDLMLVLVELYIQNHSISGTRPPKISLISLHISPLALIHREQLNMVMVLPSSSPLQVQPFLITQQEVEVLALQVIMND